MSRLQDTVETLTNTVGGFFIAYAVALWVFPLLGIPMNPATAGSATAVMFCVSTVRAFTFRRLFRWWEHRTRYTCKHCGVKFYTYAAMKEHEWLAHQPAPRASAMFASQSCTPRASISHAHAVEPNMKHTSK